MATDSIDTNIILRYIVGDVPGQAIAAEDLLRAPGDTHRVEDLVISETVYVLSTQYGKSRREVVDLISFFLARFSDTLDYNHKLTAEVFPFFLAHPKLSFNDCCLVAYAEINHAEPLFTFDKKLSAQAPGAKLLA